MPERPAVYMSRVEFAERIGVQPGALSRYKLPPPDVVVGPLNGDGTIPRGTVRGWLPATIDEWNANRPGRGARTDLKGDG
ncbi:hypothetical protein GS894_02825 [Rhodococcus hoagii]|nr:hypothetical protein [Prescottella equi]NKR90357.1 hypothetical protein [Prescottella equi]NKS06762.1 hypothetical protein [Prescottella equi]NKT07350.1 hypothetical protein [Prescottella equi]NKT11972.1 hypothetical protein [Prescottella equi]